jgi:hypothetical protein
MECWKCKGEVDEKKISFRTICEACHSWLHCCKGCKNYKPGLPNDCKIPGTDQISDREGVNFCEEFSPLLKVKEKNADASDVSKKLFGEDFKEKKSFDDLF